MNLKTRLRRLCSTSMLYPGLILVLSGGPAVAEGWTHYLTDYVKLQGQARGMTEYYHVQGAERRRPASTNRLYISPTLNFTRYFSIGVDLMLSDEGSSARQDMNIMGLHPSWKWGRAHIGDFSVPFSRYTFQGVNVRGAGVELFPGWLRFAAGGGQSRRAVKGNILQQSFDQYLYTSRVGYQFKNGSFVDVIVLKARDDAESLRQPELELYDEVIVDTLETELDTLWIEPPYNPYAKTPEDNFLVGIAGTMQFLDKRLRLDFEGTGSAFTQNLWAEAVSMDSLELPGPVRSLLNSVFQPRQGSHVDYAMRAECSYRLNSMQFRAGYGYIGPGYQSLGTPSTVNDRQELLLDTRFKIGSNRFSFNFIRLSDNLLDQKQVTNIRNQFRAGVNRHSQRYRSSYQINVLLMNSDAVVDSLLWDYSNLVFNTNQSLVFDRSALFRQLGVRYTYQQSDKNLYRHSTRSHYHTLNMTLQMNLKDVSLNGSAGLSFRKSPNQGVYTTQVYTIRLTHHGFDNRLANSLFTTSSMVRDTRVLRTGLASSYRLSSQNSLVLNVSYNFFRGRRDFQELRSGLSLSHRF